MRLLRFAGENEVQLTNDIVNSEAVPPYAILSHTWSMEEVEFDDVQSPFRLDEISTQKKESWDKIRFCARQAKLDGLNYFWVDTCCINKANSTELSEAINSMFRWYQNAALCYVILSDVARGPGAEERSQPSQWKAAFMNSRWFTRGWTLQELLAPQSVEFFSAYGTQLGSKDSLKLVIHEVTGIPIEALLGSDLSNFGIDERFSWVHNRQTTREEDSAYCMLGICGCNLPLIYGEGKERALRRLRREIKEALEDIPGLPVGSYQTAARPPAQLPFPIERARLQATISSHAFDERQWEAPTKLRHMETTFHSIRDFATRPNASIDCQEVLRMLEDGTSQRTVQTSELVLSVQQDWSGRGAHVHFGSDETIPLDKGRVLGHGINGEVLEVACQGVKMALKTIYHSRKITVEQIREISILRKLKHRHVIKLLGTYIQRRNLGLLLWPVAQCDLATLMSIMDKRSVGVELEDAFNDYDMNAGEFDAVAGPQNQRVWSTFGCLTSAMLYLHENNIRHKDVKPSNVLLSRNGVWITDFGASKDFTSDFTSTSASQERGTLKYCAPEVAKFEDSGRSADIFSLGCVFLEMMVVLVNNHTLSELESRRPLRNGSYEANLQYMEDWFALVDTGEPQVQHILYEIRQMLDGDRARRPTAFALDLRMTGIDLYTKSQTRRVLRGSCCGGEGLSASTVFADPS